MSSFGWLIGGETSSMSFVRRLWSLRPHIRRTQPLDGERRCLRRNARSFVGTQWSELSRGQDAARRTHETGGASYAPLCLDGHAMHRKDGCAPTATAWRLVMVCTISGASSRRGRRRTSPRLEPRGDTAACRLPCYLWGLLEVGADVAVLEVGAGVAVFTATPTWQAARRRRRVQGIRCECPS